MEESFTATPNPYSPNQATLLHNGNKPMKNLQDFVLKLSQAHPNAPLSPPTETLLWDRLDRFVSDYRTPDHPPYSAMIQNALQELNEKGGSSKKSISQYLEKRYDSLPWAHSILLKHYLEKTCESDEIVVTRTKKYRLAGSPNVSVKLKSKPRRRKWRWECERQKHHQLKIRLIKKRNKQRDKKVDVVKKHQEFDEKEQTLSKEGVHGPGEDQMTSSLSCVDGEKSSQSSHSISQSELASVIVAVNETTYPEEVRSEQENGPSAIENADISSAHTPEHKENKLSEHDQPEPSTPERPPGFELVRIENLYQFDSLQSNCNMETPPNQQQQVHDLNQQQQVHDLIPINVKQMHYEKHEHQLIKADVVEEAQSVTRCSVITRKGRRGWRRKNKLKTSEQEEIGDMVGNVFQPSLTSEESELLQQTPSQQEEIVQGKQLRRSLRARSNTMAPLPPERRPIKVYTRRRMLSKQRPRSWPHSKPMDELQDSAKSQKKRTLPKQKPDEAAVENLKVVDECREEDFKHSGKLAECTSAHEKIAKTRLQKVLKKQRLGRPPERRSARLLKQG